MATYPHLCELVEEGARGLRGVNRRRMFGCDAYFIEDAIFALIWKTGRIGVRLPDAGSYDALLAVEGAEPWCVGAKRMGHWVLVPEEFHDDAEALAGWVRRAGLQNQGGAAKPIAKAAARQGAPAQRTAGAKAAARQGAPAQRTAESPVAAKARAKRGASAR